MPSPDDLPDDLPRAIDYSSYLSWESKNRVRSQLKALRPYFDTPGMISFGGGYPHPSTWPINGMSVSVPFAGHSVFVPGFNNSSPEGLLPLAPYTAPTIIEPLRPDLAVELQYGTTYGASHFVQWITDHVERVHKPPYKNWQVLCTAGNADGIDGIMRSCMDKGDYVLVEEFAYPGTLTALASAGMNALGVSMDQHGVMSAALEGLLANWDEKARGGARPKLIILVPTCSNPSGATIPEYRRKELYAICRKWGVLIVEDDPYYFLQIRQNGAESLLIPTFLSMDVDGRILRVDSFSKIVAPGSRCGWITGPAPLVEKIMHSREHSTQPPSGIAVSAIASVLRAWGSHEGFEQRYLPYISDVYAKRCHMLLSFLKKYVPPSTVEFPAPSGGMFHWLRLRIEDHPSFPVLSSEEISDKINHALIDERVLVAPSIYFKSPSGTIWSKEDEARRIFLRVSFSTPMPDDMEEGAQRMARALKREWKIER